MRATLLRAVCVVATMALRFVGALNEGDQGVCAETETYVASQRKSNAISIVRAYRTCAGWSCRTRYRTAYRTETRTIYAIRSKQLLSCCDGYVEVDSNCESADTSTVPMTPSMSVPVPPTPPVPPLSPMSSSPKTVRSAVDTSPTDLITSLPDMVTALPSPLAFETKLIMAGIVLLLVVVVVIVLILVVVVTRRRRKRQLAGEFTQPRGAYFSFIGSTVPGGDGADAATPPLGVTESPQDPSSGPPTSAKPRKKNTFKTLSVFYTKIKKGENKAGQSAGDIPTYDGGSHGNVNGLEESAHYYSRMVSADTTPTGQPRGKVGMSSPTRRPQATTAPPVADAREDDGEYSAMDSPRVSADLHEYNEFETTYDEVGHSEKRGKPSPGPRGKNAHVGGTDSSMPSEDAKPVEEDPYDKVGGEDASVVGGDRSDNREHYDQPKTSKQGDIPKPEDESMYYNTPEENALMRKQLPQEDDVIYTNVS